MTEYHHGVRVTEINTGLRVLRTVATAIIGLVATAPDADGDTFPLDTPVLITDVEAAISDAGTEGTLYTALRAIADQTRPFVVVVRVEEGADAAGTAANVIGTTVDGVRTGMQALLDANTRLKVKPRILGVPGLETLAVATALVIVAQKLRGMAYVGCPGCDTPTEAIAFRQNFAAREIMTLWPDWQAFDVTTASTVEVPAAAVALGLRARIDAEQGWHKTISNVAVNGVTGISRSVHWDLQDPDTDAGLLNAAGVTTLIHSNGYRFWGSTTCSDEPLFAFESATRTAQVLADTCAEGILWAIDKPLIPSLARDIIETINARFRGLKARGYIIGGECKPLDPTLNQPTELAAGMLTLSYDYTPVPPLENLMLNQHITDSYFADFALAVNGA